MKPTIYYLDDKTGKGQPKVIRGLSTLLFRYSEELGIKIRPVDILGDLLMVIEHPKLNIGLVSHENVDQSPADLVRFLEEERCAVIFSSSINRNHMDKAIARLISKGKYQSVYLKSAFSSIIEVGQLTEHEIQKLFDMVSMILEYSGESNPVRLSESVELN